MIVYFDTSALVPLLIREPGSETAGELWDGADRLVSVRLIYPEARAALAQAHRLGRIDDDGFRSAKRGLKRLMEQLDIVELTEHLAQRAGDLAEDDRLRGYDSVHLAAAETLVSPEAVMAVSDARLGDAALSLGLAVATITP